MFYPVVIHSSQKIEEERENGIVISIHVIPNFELEKEILSFGDRMVVLSPEKLRKQIGARLKKALELTYNFRQEIAEEL